MTIRARFGSQCPKCNGQIQPGEEVSWSKGQKATHVKCPSPAKISADAKQVMSSGPARSTDRTNKRADNCMNCGTWVPSGAGILVFCMEDGGCREHFDQSGYHVACKDEATCQAARKETQAARKAAKQAQADKAAADKLAAEAAQTDFDASVASATAGLVRTDLRPETSGQPTRLASISKEQGKHGNSQQLDSWQDGQIVTLSTQAHDDYRTAYYVTEAVADALVTAWMTEPYRGAHPMTLESVTGWLAKYRGCSGTQDYERAARLLA